jgi:hypothetical protein
MQANDEDKLLYISDLTLIKVMPWIKYDHFLNKDIRRTSLLTLAVAERLLCLTAGLRQQQ